MIRNLLVAVFFCFLFIKNANCELLEVGIPLDSTVNSTNQTKYFSVDVGKDPVRLNIAVELCQSGYLVVYLSKNNNEPSEINYDEKRETNETLTSLIQIQDAVGLFYISVSSKSSVDSTNFRIIALINVSPYIEYEFLGSGSNDIALNVFTDGNITVYTSQNFLFPSSCYLESSTSTSYQILNRNGSQTILSIKELEKNQSYYVVIIAETSKGRQIMLPSVYRTKDMSNCQFVWSTEFCGQIGGSVYIPSSKTPESIDLACNQSFAGFQAALSQFNCEIRYSFVRTCQNCTDSYKKWVCATELQQCAEKPNQQYGEEDRRRNTEPVCMKICYDVMQSCPNFLNFICPTPDSPSFSTYQTCSSANFLTISSATILLLLSFVTLTSI